MKSPLESEGSRESSISCGSILEAQQQPAQRQSCGGVGASCEQQQPPSGKHDDDDKKKTCGGRKSTVAFSSSFDGRWRIERESNFSVFCVLAFLVRTIRSESGA